MSFTAFMTYTPDQSELGKKSQYDSQYDASKLFPISRHAKREAIHITDTLPFFGVDVWNHYEVSWLNEKGKPIVAVAEIRINCETPNIIESKSMKLYFNSLNNTVFKDHEAVEAIVQKDLFNQLGSDLAQVRIIPLSQLQNQTLFARLEGINLDALDIDCATYTNEPTLLRVEPMEVEETLCSDLLKSNCLVTNQPDWCSVQISYRGKKINHQSLLRYLVSFRNDNEFHEHCIEKIFMHLMQQCAPESLTVYGRSTRRGGIDINSYRSTEAVPDVPNLRLYRQ